MNIKVGDVCRVNAEYEIGDGFLTGSIVQVVRTEPPMRVYAKFIFSTVSFEDNERLFYDTELDLITGEPYND